MGTKFMTDNYLNVDLLASKYVSSEKTNFPEDNLYESSRRSKVWRSDGSWEVTSSNNELVFRETAAGPDLTATVTVAAYASDSSFFTALETALEATGASSYTISRDGTTSRITIVSNGGGGAGDFSLMHTDGGSTLSADLGYSTAADDTGALTYTADVLKIATDEWLKFDFGVPTNPGAFLLIGSKNDPIPLTPSGTFNLQGSITDSWASPEYDETLTYDSRVITKYEATDGGGLHTEPLRYWRVQFIDNSNANTFIEVGAIYLGDVFELSRGGVQFPWSGTKVDRSTTVFSEGGQSFSDIREEARTETIQMTIKALTTADKEEFDGIFQDLGTSEPFFINFDPDAANSSSAEVYTRYVKFESPPRWTLESPGNYQLVASVREQL